jgi:putative ABC transport system permease protein
MRIPLAVLDRKLLRDLWKSKGQVLAVSAVILCGIASFVSVSSAYRNLKLTRDTYYRQYRLADFWINFERAPNTAVFRIEAIPGVRQARGRIVQDVNLDLEGDDEPKIGRIVSMPDRPRTVLNDIHLTAGRYFSGDALDEVILSDRFAKANRLTIGDRIRATINTRKETLRIVGTALSPEYVYMIRNGQEFLPNDKGFAVLFVKETFAEMILDMREACNEIVGTVDDARRLDVILDQAEKALEPFGVFAKIKRADQISNQFLSNEIKGLGVSAKITPNIFLGVAAMILAILLSRMVKRERTEIGLLKAYGYDNISIMSHYLKFALTVAIAGWIGGVLAGNWLSYYMIRLYQEFFQFPLLAHRNYAGVIGFGLATALLSGAFGASFAVWRVLHISPAQSMQPEAPRLGGAILIERIAWLWRRVSFSWKMILRNMARYKVRAALTILGVTIATAILLFGRFMGDTVDRLMDHQFREMQRQDMKVTFEAERGKAAAYDLARLEYVERVEPLFEYPFEIRHGWRKKELLITGFEPGARLLRLRNEQGEPLDVSRDGLILTQRTMAELDLRPGDAVEIKPLMGKVRKSRTVVVRPAVSQYLGMAAYMNIEQLSRLADESLAMNGALLRVDRGRERALSRKLKDVPAVGAVVIKHEMLKAFEKTLARNMQVMNTIMLVFAGVIAFAIIYNSTSITIVERNRELASLRVLGFTREEVGRIVFRENWLLSIFGVFFGIPLGLVLCRVIIVFYNNDLYQLPFYIRSTTFLWTAASIAVFVLIANWTSRRRISGLDMVEVLKSRQ